MTQITDHLADIERRTNEALQRAGRAGETVTVVGVSKRQPTAAILEASRAGLQHFGENYLQEALEKISTVAAPNICWHFIGRIQSNKTRTIAENFSWVETVDRSRIADRLAAQRPADLGPLNVLIQLNLDDEPQKGGVSAADLLPLARHIHELPMLQLRGVMGMPPAGQSESAARQSFAAIKAQADRLQNEGIPIDTVSMGMSSDFEVAIECGANQVRIGTALFGQRPSATE